MKYVTFKLFSLLFMLKLFAKTIACITDVKVRSDCLKELNNLVEQSAVPRPPDRSVFYNMAYDLLVQLADRVPYVSSSLREGLSLPSISFVPVEVLYHIIFFYSILMCVFSIG